MFKLIVWLHIVLWIAFMPNAKGNKETVQFKEDFKKAMETAVTTGKMKLSQEQVLKGVPPPVATITKTGGIPKRDYTSDTFKFKTHLENVFVVLNKYNKGQTIQQKGASVILWSGMEGEKKASELAKASQKKYALGEDDAHHPVYVDTTIKALQDGFKVIDPPPSTNAKLKVVGLDKKDKTMFRTFLCMWLIFNADITNGIDQYSSIGAYERYIPIAKRGTKDKGVLNKGLKQIIKGKVTQAVLIGSYFWDVEMIAIARLAHAKRKTPKVNLYLRQYDIGKLEGKDKLPKALKWAGPCDLNTLKGGCGFNIPIIFRAPGDHDQFYIKEAPTMLKLIDLYNAEVKKSKKGKEISITSGVLKDIDALIAFVEWTKKFAKAKKPKKFSAKTGYRDYYWRVNEYVEQNDIENGYMDNGVMAVSVESEIISITVILYVVMILGACVCGAVMGALIGYKFNEKS